MNLRSFRTRLIWLVLLVLVPMTILVLWANIQRQKANQARLKTEALAAAKVAAALEEYYLEQTRQLLGTMSGFPHLVQLSDLKMSELGMRNLKLLSPDYENFGILETNGIFYCDALTNHPSAPPVSSNFIARGMSFRKFVMSDLEEWGSRGKALHFSVPVREGNAGFKRTLFATLKTSLLSTALAKIPLPEDGKIMVFDLRGNVVAESSPEKKLVGMNLANERSVSRVLAGDTSVFEVESLEESTQVVATSPAACDNEILLYVQVSVPRKVLFAEADAQFAGSLLAVVAVGLMVMGVAKIFSERAFLQPLNALMLATGRLATGDSRARTGLQAGAGELHTLAARFDSMAEILERRQAELAAAHIELQKSHDDLEKKVRERTHELQMLNTELEAFSYSVSHDLRAPLRHMRGFAELLATDEQLESHPVAPKYLGLICKAATEMGNLINDLLSFSKTATQPVAMQPFEMGQLIDEVLVQIKGRPGAERIKWDVQSMPKVFGDRALLRQVWVNLLENAVKYSAHTPEPHIRIESKTEGAEFIFSVADNGAGFDMKYADKLFGVFQRLHKKEDFEGTGIGLANVRRIVSRHRGRTWAHGKIEAGATFYFSLPIISS